MGGFRQFHRMEKGEVVAITERVFLCLGEGGFTFPICHETVVYPKYIEMVTRKKNIYYLLVHQRVRAGRWVFLEEAEPLKRIIWSRRREPVKKGTSSPTLLSIYLSHYKLGYLYIFSRGKI